jgi:hypothetical protein
VGSNPGQVNQIFIKLVFVASRSALSWRDQVTIRLDDDDFRFVLDQHTKLDLYNASSLKQQSACRHVAPL